MKRSSLALILLVLAAATVRGQSDLNELHFSFGESEIGGIMMIADTCMQGYADFTGRTTGTRASIVRRRFTLHDTRYFIMRADGDTTDSVTIESFSDPRQSGRLECVVDLMRPERLDSAAAERYVAEHASAATVRYKLYDFDELKRFATYPRMDTITVAKFRSYLRALNDCLREVRRAIQPIRDSLASSAKTYFSSHELEILALSNAVERYVTTKAHEILADLGYCPLIPTEKIDTITGKFHDDPRCQDLFEEYDKLIKFLS